MTFQPPELGIDSFAAMMPDMATGIVPSAGDRMAKLIEEIEAADRAGLHAFGIGEHHRAEFIDSSPAVILAAGAARTSRIKLNSAVTVLSAADPVRVFEDFATLDLISRGRAELIVGRGSFVDAFPLYGFNTADYDALFIEKLLLLLQLQTDGPVHWSGRFRAPLTGQRVLPRPEQPRLPVWVGVGGTPESFVRTGTLGLPLMVAVIGGSFDRFRPLIDLYREAGKRAGHDPDTLQVGLHAMGFVADTDAAASDIFFQGWYHVFTEMAKDRGWTGASRAQFDAMVAPGGAFLVGSPERVATKILDASRILGGLSRVSFQMSAASGNHAAMLRSIELLGTEVLPRLSATVTGRS